MMRIKDAIKTQNILREDIQTYYKKGQYEQFLELVNTFAEFTTHFNHEMADGTIESLLHDFACQQIGVRSVAESNEPNNTVVFYDQIGTTICLGVQYLKGLVASGFDVYYVFDSTLVDINPALEEELCELKVHVKIFDKRYSHNDCISRICGVRDFIAGTRAKRLIVHSPAANSYSSAVLYALNNIVKYRVVPGDHHFYTGVNCIDYFYEFREYGVGIANMYRHIPLNKIIKLPYYPISETFCDFQGFPKEADGKVIILAAGSESKFFGSDLFFNVSKQILKKYPQTVILYIGRYTKKFVDFVKENHLERRFILLGYRNDFNHCMSHCDILLGSYPMAGGLVSQIAALYKKPIIGIKENEDLAMFNNLEAIMGIGEDLGITHNVNEDLFDYADKLITDEEYRKACGNRLFELMFREREFSMRLKATLLNPAEYTHETYREDIVKKNKEHFSNYCLKLQNERRPNSIAPLYKFYGILFFIKYPYFTCDCLRLMIQHLMDRIV